MNTTYGYDGADSLISVHHDGPAGSLARFDYTLDANGNRTSVNSAAGTDSYTLDALNRLTGVTYPNADTAAYTYDAAGNRLTSTLNGLLLALAVDVGLLGGAAAATPSNWSPSSEDKDGLSGTKGGLRHTGRIPFCGSQFLVPKRLTVAGPHRRGHTRRY